MVAPVGVAAVPLVTQVTVIVRVVQVVPDIPVGLLIHRTMAAAVAEMRVLVDMGQTGAVAAVGVIVDHLLGGEVDFIMVMGVQEGKPVRQVVVVPMGMVVAGLQVVADKALYISTT